MIFYLELFVNQPHLTIYYFVQMITSNINFAKLFIFPSVMSSWNNGHFLHFSCFKNSILKMYVLTNHLYKVLLYIDKRKT